MKPSTVIAIAAPLAVASVLAQGAVASAAEIKGLGFNGVRSVGAAERAVQQIKAKGMEPG